jgi:threonyl-tRNA synthetase
MIIMKITLKDGSFKEYEGSMSVLDITKDISEGLARVATSARVNGEVVDLRHVVDEDCELEILTFDNEEGKGAFWHTTSHIMAQAIKRLYPDTKLAIGPSIENGFYYDVDRETPFAAEDLEKIEKEMKKIVKENLKFLSRLSRLGIFRYLHGSCLQRQEKMQSHISKKKMNHIKLN